MPTNPDSKKKRILAFDSQILTSLQKCGFATFLRFMKRLEMNEKPFGMERGGFGHELTQTYYGALKAKVDWEDAIAMAAEAGRKKALDSNLMIEQTEELIKHFYSYAEYYRYDGMEVLEVEEPFTIPLFEDDELIILYEGKVDLLNIRPNIGVNVMDHKFRSRMVNYTPLDNQFFGYAIAKDVDVVYVDEIGLQKTKEPKDKYRRIPLSFTKGMKERWIRNTVGWGRTLDHYLQNNYWPMQMINTKEGPVCIQCQFHDICISDNDEEAARKIKQMFHIGDKWDVGNVKEEAIVE